MILGKISTAISIKHRILATFNIKKKSILTAYMPLNNQHWITKTILDINIVNNIGDTE
jgi:hypothetical protein